MGDHPERRAATGSGRLSMPMRSVVGRELTVLRVAAAGAAAERVAVARHWPRSGPSCVQRTSGDMGPRRLALMRGLDHSGTARWPGRRQRSPGGHTTSSLVSRETRPTAKHPPGTAPAHSTPPLWSTGSSAGDRVDNAACSTNLRTCAQPQTKARPVSRETSLRSALQPSTHDLMQTRVAHPSAGDQHRIFS